MSESAYVSGVRVQKACAKILSLMVLILLLLMSFLEGKELVPVSTGKIYLVSSNKESASVKSIDKELRRVADTYLKAWQKADYRTMYRYLTQFWIDSIAGTLNHYEKVLKGANSRIDRFEIVEFYRIDSVKNSVFCFINIYSKDKKTAVHVQFVKENGVWKLNSEPLPILQLLNPNPKKNPLSALHSEKVKQVAPKYSSTEKEIRKVAQEYLKGWQKADYRTMYKHLTQSWIDSFAETLSHYEKVLKDANSQIDRFEIVSFHQSGIDKNSFFCYINVYFKGKKTAYHFEFIRENGVWKVNSEPLPIMQLLSPSEPPKKPISASDREEVKQIAQKYLSAWQKGQYEDMYLLLSKKEQKLAGRKEWYMKSFKAADIRPLKFSLEDKFTQTYKGGIGTYVFLEFSESLRKKAVNPKVPEKVKREAEKKIRLKGDQEIEFIKAGNQWVIDRQPAFATKTGRLKKRQEDQLKDGFPKDKLWPPYVK